MLGLRHHKAGYGHIWVVMGARYAQQRKRGRRQERNITCCSPQYQHLHLRDRPRGPGDVDVEVETEFQTRVLRAGTGIAERGGVWQRRGEPRRDHAPLTATIRPVSLVVVFALLAGTESRVGDTRRWLSAHSGMTTPGMREEAWLMPALQACVSTPQLSWCSSGLGGNGWGVACMSCRDRAALVSRSDIVSPSDNVKTRRCMHEHWKDCQDYPEAHKWVGKDPEYDEEEQVRALVWSQGTDEEDYIGEGEALRIAQLSWDSLDGRLWKTMVGMRSEAVFPIAEGLDNSQYGSILMEGILMRGYCAKTFVILL
ncbi:hypothetical protein EI94DRAFT_1903835 [Lactarius quietus]|nr:hypothetical protein EI94DRAFT_1903835 [Lactarius quietus]